MSGSSVGSTKISKLRPDDMDVALVRRPGSSVSIVFSLNLPPSRESFDFLGMSLLRGPPSFGASGAGNVEGEPVVEGVAVVRRIVGITNCGGVWTTCPNDAEREC